jgi:amino acid adenylation domain-containing protein
MPNPKHNEPHKIHHLVETQSKTRPAKTAVVFFDINLSYGELNAKANQFARYLIEHNIKPSDIVPIISSKSPTYLIMILGILKTGAAYSPVNADSPIKYIEAVIKETKAKYICVEASSSDRFTFEGDALIIKSDNIEEQISSYNDEDINNNASAESDLAYVIYTSGTTGNPKGGMIAHANLLPTYFSWEQAYNLSDNDIHLQMAPVGFDVFTGDWIRALCSGGTLVLCPKSILVDSEQLYHLIKREKVNCAEFVPAILRQLINFVAKHQYNLSQLRLLVCGSDQWTMSEYRSVKRLCGEKSRVISSYGLTETTIDSSFFEEGSKDSLLDDKSIVPIGKPFDHVNIYLVNDERLALPGETGEIYIGGSGVGLGYLNQSKLTSDKFVFKTFTRGTFERLYRTGDQGKVLNGNLLFLGRNQEHIKIQGKRVDLPSLEAVINQLPKIKFAIVTPTLKLDSNEFILKCYFTLKDDSLTFEELTDHIRAELPCYYIPKEFYQVEAIPLSLNGKVDKSPASQKVIKELRPIIHSPKDEIQTYLINLWKEILGIDKVGIKNNFHNLGGSSLSFVAMLNKVNKKFNLNISPTIELVTIEELSKHIESHRRVLTRSHTFVVACKEDSKQIKLPLLHSTNIFSPTLSRLTQKLSRTSLPEIQKKPLLSSFFQLPLPLKLTGATKALLSLAFRRGK